MSKPVSRRKFLGAGGRAAAGVAAASAIHTMLRDAKAADANSKFNVALIGCGGMGRRKLQNFVQSNQVNVVALCDVDPNQIETVVKDKVIAPVLNSDPRRVKDYREIADMKDVDMVIVATPDHWHCATTMACIAGGKNVYCEKPATHDIREARKMLDTARKYKKTLQIGTHQRSAAHMQEAREFVQSGKLGKITMTNTYTYGNESPQGNMPNKTDPPPKGLDYNMWLGAAPERAFNWHRFHFSWRWFFDYGSGMVGDWNVHLQDIIMWTMNAMYPISVTTLGGKYVLEDDRTTPDTMQTIYEFPGFVQTYTMRKASGKPWWYGGYGMDFHGTNGLLHLTREGWEVDPDVKNEGANTAEGKEPRVTAFKKPGKDSSLDHALNFLNSVRDGKEPIASIEKHFPVVVACHLANVSLKVGRQVFWDKNKELCFKDRELTIEDKEANQHLGREYRKGFELPDVL